MKRIWTTAIIIGMLLMSMGTVVSASANPTTGTFYNYEKQSDEAEALYGSGEDDLALSSKNAKKARFAGIWGYSGENETKGYVGGFLARKGRVGVLKGLWNTTDNTTKGRVAGILKKGFFVGKITTNGSGQRIVGLYRVDQEKKVLHVKWMTAQIVGWAHCRIKLQ